MSRNRGKPRRENMQFTPPLPLNCAGRTKQRCLEFLSRTREHPYRLRCIEITGGKFFYFLIKIKIHYSNQFGMIWYKYYHTCWITYYYEFEQGGNFVNWILRNWTWFHIQWCLFSEWIESSLLCLWWSWNITKLNLTFFIFNVLIKIFTLFCDGCIVLHDDKRLNDGLMQLMSI